ncbi:MAG: hypothetical protein ACKVYV_04040 [Limisphaerales bacterium]
MSSPNPELELDLDLQFLPAWARQPSSTNRYAGHAGEAEDRRLDRDRPRQGFRDDRSRGPRPGGGRGPGPGPGGPRRDDRGRDQRPHGGPPRGQERGPDFRSAPDRPPLPTGFDLHFLPDEAGLEQLGRQIRHTGRAYALLDIAHLILKRPERYHLEFRAVAREGAPAPQFWLCSLDDTLWLSEADAVRHALGRHFDTFYKATRTPTEKPKGTYTFVARCGLSGVILGPPNHHDYQNALRRLHLARFERMPFEAFKARVQIVRDEAVVQQWIEEQSFVTEYECLNLPEPLRLPTLDAVHQHFRDVHLANVIRTVDRFSVRTPAARDLLPPPLKALARRELDVQQRFPIKVITLLSDRLTRAGLQLFKVNKTALHICAARPRFLDLEANPASDSVRRLVETIGANLGLNRRQLLEKLGVALPPPPVEGQPAPTDAAPPSPELAGLIADLHWLIHQGHVIEFADGHLETAKRPAPRPPPPPPKPARAPSPAASTGPAAAKAAPEAESAPSAEAVTTEIAVSQPATAEIVPAPAAEEAVPSPS